MSHQWWKDDDQLLAALREAFQSERNVPSGIHCDGQGSFRLAWYRRRTRRPHL